MPERWLVDPRYTNDNQNALQPISFRPRACVGKRYVLSLLRRLILKARGCYVADMKIQPPVRRNAEYFRSNRVEL